MSRESKGAGLAEPPAESGGEPARAGAGEKRDAAKAVTPRVSKHSVLREYFESLVVTAVMALFGMTFVVQAVKVPTGSMQNTILIGDHLLVNKFIFAPGPVLPFLPQREIRRGDIIVFKYPGKYNDAQFLPKSVSDTVPFKTNYVKRVVGMPGELVEVRGTDVFINGQPLPEHKVWAFNPPNFDNPETSGDERGAPLRDERDAPLVNENMPKPDGESDYNVFWEPDPRDPREPRRVRVNEKFRVPEGHYFVMGDNRDNSEDGRYWGYVPRELVIGRAMFVYWSYDESLPSGGNFLIDFVRNTRWGRTGTLVK
jgi:signal peptidase I